MTEYPWLPQPLEYRDFDNDEARMTDAAYAIFSNDFIDSHPECSGKAVKPILTLLANGMEESFWHLISEEKKKGRPRVFEVQRCERINWPRAVIERLASGDVICLKKLHHEGGKKEWRWKIALNDFSYLVVLAVRRTCFLLRTAYPVTRNHTIVKLANEYASCDRCP